MSGEASFEPIITLPNDHSHAQTYDSARQPSQSQWRLARFLNSASDVLQQDHWYEQEVLALRRPLAF